MGSKHYNEETAGLAAESEDGYTRRDLDIFKANDDGTRKTVTTSLF